MSLEQALRCSKSALKTEKQYVHNINPFVQLARNRWINWISSELTTTLLTFTYSKSAMDENFRHERVKQDLTVKSCLKSYSKRFNIFLCKIHFSFTSEHFFQRGYCQNCQNNSQWNTHDGVIKRKSENPQHTALF